MELDKAISLLDRDLSNLAIGVENMENISLSDLFAWKISCSKCQVVFEKFTASCTYL